MDVSRRALLAGGAAIGIGVAATQIVKNLGRVQEASQAVANDTILHADFHESSYYVRGKTYSSLSEFLTAVGGVEVGSGIVIGPHSFGPLLLNEPFLSGSVGEFVSSPSYASAGVLSVTSGALRVAPNGTGSQYRFRAAVPVVTGRAYKMTAKMIAWSGGQSEGSVSINLSNNTDLGSGAASAFDFNELPNQRSITAAMPSTPAYVGAVLALAPGQTPVADVSDFTLQEVVPFDGYAPRAVSGRVRGTMPSVAGSKVIFQFGADRENDRIRLSWGADSRLRFITTANNAEQANLDLGVVPPGAGFDVEFSAATNRVMARLGQGAVLGGVLASHPAAAKLWLKRSFTGEEFDGTLDMLELMSAERAPLNAISMEGDSYSSPSGAGGVSGQVILAAQSGRPVFSTGVGGSDLISQRDRVLANPGLFRGVFVHWDGDANSTQGAATDLAAYAAVASALGHDRFIFITPGIRADQDVNKRNASIALRSALAAAYPNNCLDSMSILDGEGTGNIPTGKLQSDLAHLTQSAMTEVMSAVSALVASRNW